MKLLLFLLLPVCSSGQHTADDSLRFLMADIAKFCIVESNLKTITWNDLTPGFRVGKDSTVGFIFNSGGKLCKMIIIGDVITFKFFTKVSDNIFDTVKKYMGILYVCEISRSRNEMIFTERQ